MTEFNILVPPIVSDHVAATERDYLTRVFDRYDGYPRLEQVWQLMDEAWTSCGCDPYRIDERVTAFYRHPVWLLNGLFIEQHYESLRYRRLFADWVLQQSPARVADYGGGFGSLARLIGRTASTTIVEVVEPHPHSAAVALAAETSNVRFVPELTGEYDIVIATDVFEHVPDPLALAAQTATFVRAGGSYLMANCFRPVILCHLPQLFYLDYAWHDAMSAMRLIPAETVAYGRVFRRGPTLNLSAARNLASCAARLHPVLRRLPRRLRYGAMQACRLLAG
jgi:2-polyprenyl-3-methyl-5-hydroxy-6-metoxy-1,4-benzoquinol methylase